MRTNEFEKDTGHKKKRKSSVKEKKVILIKYSLFIDIAYHSRLDISHNEFYPA